MHWLYRDAAILDPCAGEGEAIFALRQLWTDQVLVAEEETFPTEIQAVACEMEAGRAEALRRLASAQHTTLYHADAFTLEMTCQPSEGAAALFLNPPYDHDRQYGRLEHRFLQRFTKALIPGHGALLFLLPQHALAASADLLARHYREIRAWRFPDPYFAAFSQVC